MNKSASGPATRVTPHSLAARFAHWGFTVVFIYALAKQLDELEELEDFALLQAEMSFAALFLVLLAIRFLFMQSTRPSALPRVPRRERLLARTVHIAMYVSLALIALTGLLIGRWYGAGIRGGDAAMDFVLLLHEIAVNTTYVLILGHVAAAIYHRRNGDGVWDSMVPVWSEPDPVKNEESTP